MVQFLRLLALGCAAQLLLSCENGGSADVADGGAAQPAYRVKSGEMFDDDSAAMVDRYGAMNPALGGAGGGSASESSVVNKQFDSAYDKRDFSGKSYDRKSFWGKKDYAKEVYEGGTDGKRFQQGAREGGLWAKEGSVVSNESGRSYDRGREFGGSANENSKARLGRPSDAEVDGRRAVFQQPKIEDVQRKRALSVDDTRSMLGR